MLAVLFNNLAITTALLKAKADVDIQNDQGGTALFIASSKLKGARNN